MQNMNWRKACIGLDQSYSNFGIAIAIDNKIKLKTSYNFPSKFTKTEKRLFIKRKLISIFKKLYIDYKINDIIIIFERIRTFSEQKDKKQGFGIKPVYMVETGKMLGTIIDTAYENGINCYSVDTRAWKSQIVGSSKSVHGDTKLLTVRFVEKMLGIDCKLYKNDILQRYIRGKNAGKVKYNDDMADAICIALYGFISESKQKLRLER